MAAATLLIRVAADIASLKTGVDAATGQLDKLNTAVVKSGEGLERAAQSSFNLGNAFKAFTLAGLAVTAISKLTTELTNLVLTGTKLAPVQEAFSRLTSGIGIDSRQMLSTLQTATKGMVSNFDLMLSANKAMLLGLPISAKSMGELAGSATALGKAMGLDATTALDNLIVALGRSSPLILDNLGLTVKVGEANERYAATLHKTVEQLTEQEKKMAFYNAAMEAARIKTAQLGEQTKTLGEIAVTIWTKVGNVVSGTVSLINVGVGAMISETATGVSNITSVLGNLTTHGLRATVAMKLVNDQMAQVARAAQTPILPPIPPTYVQQLAAASKGLAGITKETRAQWEAAVKLGATTEDITTVLKLSSLQQRLLAQEVKDTKKELKDFAKEAAEMVDRVKTETKARFDNQIALQKQFNSLREYVTEHRKLTPMLAGTIEQFTTWADRIDLANDRLKLQAKIIGDDLGQAQDRVRRILAQASDDLAEQERKKRREINLTIDAVGQMGNVLGGIAGAILTTAASIGQAFMNMGKSVAGGVSFAITGYTALVAFFERNDAKLQAGGRFIREQGGIEALKNATLTAGTPGDVKHLQTGGADAIAPTIARINQHLKEAQERLERYGLTWRDLGDIVKQSNIDEITRGLLKDWKALNLAGVDATKAMAKAMSSLVVEAVKTGAKIPAAMKPMLEMLIRSKQLTEEAARALLGLAADTMPSLEDITAASERYGLTLDQLGPKVKQLQISKDAAQIVADFDLLIRAGADVGTVMGSMKDKVQGMVTSALVLGLSLPESMRPLLQQMLNAGLLTDQFGNKLTSLEGIKFEKPLTEAIDLLIAKLDELIDSFSKVGTAAEAGFGRARGAAEQTGHAVPRGGLNLNADGSVTFPSGAADEATGRTQNITVNLDGRTIASNTVRHMPDVLTIQGI